MRRRKATYKKRTRIGTAGKPDFHLLIIVSFLTLFGWIMVYSSSVIVAFSQDRNSWYYFYRQFIWIILGLIAGYFLYRFDYHKLPKVAPILITASILMLIVVLFAGVEIGGAKRWIDLPLFDPQPSEFTKLALIIYLASWLSRKTKAIKYKNPLRNYLVVEMLPFLLILSIILVLILIEPDLGTTALIGIVALGMYYMAGEGFIHNIGFFAIMLTSTLIGLLAAFLESYRINRIKTYLTVLKTGTPEDRLGSGYQLSQMLTAIGAGGILGEGFGQSRQKFNYLGETAFSDTIFAVIAEELGLLGASAIVACFLYISLRGLKIAQNAPDKLGALLASGITLWISFQAFLNIAANVGLIPLTGIALPFISYGGSSMIVLLASLGLLLNISKYANLD